MTQDQFEDLLRDLRDKENLTQAGFYAHSENERRASWSACLDALAQAYRAGQERMRERAASLDTMPGIFQAQIGALEIEDMR